MQISSFDFSEIQIEQCYKIELFNSTFCIRLFIIHHIDYESMRLKQNLTRFLANQPAEHSTQTARDRGGIPLAFIRAQEAFANAI